MRSLLLIAVLMLSGGPPTRPAAAAEPEWVSLFDGRTLTGWRGQDMSFWSIEDDAITGTIRTDHIPPMNQYLIWEGGLMEDFELELTHRITGSSTPNVNGGFQFRSRRLPNGDVAGYQVDNNFGQPWKVRLYDEFGRHDLALEGQQTVFQADGRKDTQSLVLEPGASDFRLDAWHVYHLRAQGRSLQLRINGKLVATVDDRDADSFEPAGLLGLQLHTGPTMKAQFKEIRFRRLPRATPALDPRAALLAVAALHWQPGERPDAHQPPLKPSGPNGFQFAAGVASTGPGARNGARCARLGQAWLDIQKDLNAPKAWNAEGNALTVYVRARVPRDAGSVPLFGKRESDADLNFNLTSTSAERGSGSLQFEIRTTEGVFRVSAPSPLLAGDAEGWQDLVGWYDGQFVRLLGDGHVLAEQPASGKLQPSVAPLRIGAEMDAGKEPRYFTGELEELGLWPRALTPAELALLAAAGQVVQATPAVPAGP